MTNSHETSKMRLLEEGLEVVLGAAPEEREQKALEVCRGDEALARELLELAELAGPSSDYFDQLGSEVRNAAEAEMEQQEKGRRIGPFRILQRLGEGGMGVVYLAERADGEFEQQVALKLVRADRSGLTERFRLERQILARLEHPNIARLLDGGITPEGELYFAMELVRGTPLLEFADERRLTVPERVALFERVCRAVDHAHRNLIVHRDLKPSNVVVSDEGEVKLLDFGIAKLLSEPDDSPRSAVSADVGSDETLALSADAESALTRTGQQAMTPRYAAPEQLEGGTVTVATDIYGLGGILYHLLVGRPHREMLAGANLAAETHSAMSTAVSEVADAAALRSTKAADLVRLLRGDLSAICEKALRRDPDERYRSALEIVDELVRLRTSRPVLARPQTLAYRSRLFVRRNRQWLSLAAAGLLVAAVLATALVRQYQNTKDERDRSTELASTLSDILQFNDPGRATQGGSNSLLELSVSRIEQLTELPETQASLFEVAGRIFQSLGEYERSRELLERASVQRTTLLGEDHPQALETRAHFAETLRRLGDYRAASEELERAYLLAESALGESDPATAKILSIRARVDFSQRRLPEAQAGLERALELQRETIGELHVDTADTLSSLAAVHFGKRDLERAESLFREALAIQERLLSPAHPAVAAEMSNVAAAVSAAGRFDEAITLYRDALAKYQTSIGERHPRVATMINNLGLTLYRAGDLDAAERELSRSVALRRELLAPSHPELAQSLDNLGLALQDLGRLSEARPAFEEALRIRNESLSAQDPRRLNSLNNLGRLLQRLQELDAAEQYLREGLDLARSLFGASHPVTATVLSNIGSVQHEAGQLDAARATFQESLELRQAALPEQHLDLSYSYLGLGRVEATAGETALAREWLAQALAVRERALPEDHDLVLEVRAELDKLAG